MLNRPLPPVRLGRNFSLPLSFSEPLAQPLFDVQAPLAFVSPWFSWPLPPASAPQPRSHLCASLAPLPPAWQPVPQLSWLLLLQLTFLLVLSVVCWKQPSKFLEFSNCILFNTIFPVCHFWLLSSFILIWKFYKNNFFFGQIFSIASSISF